MMTTLVFADVVLCLSPVARAYLPSVLTAIRALFLVHELFDAGFGFRRGPLFLAAVVDPAKDYRHEKRKNQNREYAPVEREK